MPTRYEVRGFYKDNVDRLRGPEGVAFHTWNVGEFSRDMEIEAAKSRNDLKLIQWRALPSPTWIDVK